MIETPFRSESLSKTLHARRTKVWKKLRTRRKRLKTCYYSANNSLRRDPRASQNFRLFKIFLSHEKKTLSIGDEKLPYLGENQMKSTNLFFYNILHLLINNSRRKIFEKFFFVFFKNLLNFSLFCNLLRLITFYGTNHFL